MNFKKDAQILYQAFELSLGGTNAIIYRDAN